MATSEFWQRLAAPMASSHEGEAGVAAEGALPRRSGARIWMVSDALTVLFAAIAATMFELRTDAVSGVRELWRGALIQNGPMWTLLALLCGFTAALILISKR